MLRRYKLKIKEFRKRVQEPRKAYDSLDSRWIGRRLSIYLTILMVRTNIQANYVTAINILIGVVAALFFLKGSYFYSVVGAALMFLYYIMNHVDGEVARYHGGTSTCGIYLDRIGFNAVLLLLFLTSGLGVYNNSPKQLFLLLSFISAISFIFSRNIILEYDALIRQKFQSKIGSKDELEKKTPSRELSPRWRRFISISIVKLNYFTEPYFIILVLIFATVIGILKLALVTFGIFLPIMTFISVYYRIRAIKAQENK